MIRKLRGENPGPAPRLAGGGLMRGKKGSRRETHSITVFERYGAEKRDKGGEVNARNSAPGELTGK